jgi:2-polyprenyl-6-methoxyphenol hydroxylase-like FAD-dependent oxidoreductase
MAGLGGKDMKCDPPTGINVAIVGGGIAGLTFAIESIRKGHTVNVYERKPEIGNFGKPPP